MNNKYLCHRKRKNNDIENVLKDVYSNNNFIKNEKNNITSEIIKENEKNINYIISHDNQYNNNKNNTYIKNNPLPKIESRIENKNKIKTFIKSKTMISEKKNNGINITPKKSNTYLTSLNFKNTKTINETNNNNNDHNTLDNVSKKNNKVSFGKSIDERFMNNSTLSAKNDCIFPLGERGKDCKETESPSFDR